MPTRMFRTFVLVIFLLASKAPAEIPRPEHPRPDFMRQDWVNLNGKWSFAFDPKDEGLAGGWAKDGRKALTRTIAVPFPWESRLSGIGDANYQGVAWYARTFAVPEGWKEKRIFLRFGAVDWECRVWVNGEEAGGSENGYLPFECEITKVLKPGDNEVVVRAKDITSNEQPVGKQIGWYTRTSGIWQTVWLEARGQEFLGSVRFTPDPATGEVKLAAETSGAKIRITGPDLPEQTVELSSRESGRGHGTFRIPDPKPWSPESPKLYDLRLELVGDDGAVQDEVKTYVAFRSVAVGKTPAGIPIVLLNGKPRYQRGALDQRFHPDGVYTMPSDDVLRGDVELAKKAGLDMLRIHIKVEEPRFYYWADKLGLLIWQDVPSTWKDSPDARKRIEATLRGMIDRDANHPSIVQWICFNETWGLTNHKTKEGQEWVRSVYRAARELDPTRLVEDNSPCNYDHVETQVNSWHFYLNDYESAKGHLAEVVAKTHPGSEFNYIGGNKQEEAPLLNSEYGGIGAGSGDRDVSWCFKFLTNELRLHEKITGYVYTELDDIEWEHNGFVNYDRTPKEFGYDGHVPGFTTADLAGADFLATDVAPCVTLAPGAVHKVPVLASLYSGKDPKTGTLRWTVTGFDAWGNERKWAKGERPAEGLEPYRVVPLGAVEVPMPKEPAVVTVAFELVDAAGERLARNFVNVEVRGGDPPRAEKLEDNVLALRFEPADVHEIAWERYGGDRTSGGEKVYGYGNGRFAYRLKNPVPLKGRTDLQELMIVAELSAKAMRERVDWPTRFNWQDCPQTDVRKWPTDYRILVNGVPVHAGTLADDPADARGVLSHHHRFQDGSYGERVEVRVTGETLALVAQKGLATLDLAFEVPAESAHRGGPLDGARGGLAIFGDALGRYPVDPTVTLRFAKPVPELPAGAGTLAVAVPGERKETGDPSFLKHWMLAGPFDNAKRDGFATVFPPETGAGFAQVMTGKAGVEVRWKRHDAERAVREFPSAAGDLEVAAIDFRRVIKPGQDGVVYAMTEFEAEKNLDVQLRIGSDDGLKVWLDGREIFALDVIRGAEIDQDVIPVRLAKGVHRILAKVTQGVGDWAMLARFTDAQGMPVRGVRNRLPQ